VTQPKPAALLDYVLEFGLDPTGRALHLPRKFGASSSAKAMPKSASDSELKKAEKSHYNDVWTFLKDPETQALRGRSEVLDKLYKRLGEPGDNFRTWWEGRARFGFADLRTPSVFIDGDFTFGEEPKEDEPRILVMRVFLTKSMRELLEELRTKIKPYHPGDAQIKHLRDPDAFGAQRVRRQKLMDKLRVWRLRTANPNMTLAQIGEQAGVLTGKTLADRADRDDLTREAISIFTEADALMRRWARAPKPSPLKRKGKKAQ